MAGYLFSKLIPGGNPTLLLHEPALRERSLAEISARLMDPMHLFAEQAGALYTDGSGPDTPPRLIMMGGEFCVNATRAAAMCLARRGCLTPLRLSSPGCGEEEAARGKTALVLGGRVDVSGAPSSVPVLAAADPELLRQSCAAAETLEPCEGGAGIATAFTGDFLHCAARVDCSGAHCEELDEGVWLAKIPGISHLLLDASRHELPALDGSAWKIASARWRSRYGLEGEEASGVVWFTAAAGGSCRIWPAVAVSATGTEHMESACGSASLALALLRSEEHAGSGEPLTVMQPSGERLEVFPLEGPAGKSTGAAWIAGPVLLAAEGTTYL